MMALPFLFQSRSELLAKRAIFLRYQIVEGMIRIVQPFKKIRKLKRSCSRLRNSP